MKNAINWFSIPVADYDRAKAFYESVFAFTMMDVEMGLQKMAFFPVEGEGVGGALNLSSNFSPLDNDEVTVYLNAEDLEGSLARIEAAGGTVLLGKTEISPEFGYFGLMLDSEGNKIGLHSNHG